MALSTEEPRSRADVFNVPNQVTSLRLILSIVLFVLIAYQYYVASLIVFLVAVGTDWLDGYWARKYGQVTVLGRILDPFVDKVVVCGTFIFLVGVPDETGLQVWLRPWMVVVIVGREMLVTALRSFLETRGADFSASMSGKWKMVLQCIAGVLCLVYLIQFTRGGEMPDVLGWSVGVSLWAAVALTVASGIGYIHRTVQLLKV